MWALWIFSVGLLVLLWCYYRSFHFGERVEVFRGSLGLSFIFVLMKQPDEIGGWLLVLQVVMVFTAITKPQDAPILSVIGIGSIVTLFAFEALIYIRLTSELLRPLEAPRSAMSPSLRNCLNNFSQSRIV